MRWCVEDQVVVPLTLTLPPQFTECTPSTPPPCQGTPTKRSTTHPHTAPCSSGHEQRHTQLGWDRLKLVEEPSAVVLHVSSAVVLHASSNNCSSGTISIHGANTIGGSPKRLAAAVDRRQCPLRGKSKTVPIRPQPNPPEETNLTAIILVRPQYTGSISSTRYTGSIPSAHKIVYLVPSILAVYPVPNVLAIYPVPTILVRPQRPHAREELRPPARYILGRYPVPSILAVHPVYCYNGGNLTTEGLRPPARYTGSNTR